MLDFNRGLSSRAFETLFTLGPLGLMVPVLRDYTVLGIPVFVSVLFLAVIAVVGIELRNAREKFG
jgi:hypothetical protein